MLCTFDMQPSAQSLLALQADLSNGVAQIRFDGPRRVGTDGANK